MLMLLRHLGFVHGPIREHCPASLKCMDTLVEKTIAQKAHRYFESLIFLLLFNNYRFEH